MEQKNLRYNIHCIFPVLATSCLTFNRMLPEKSQDHCQDILHLETAKPKKPDWLHKGVTFPFEKGLDSLISRRSVFLFLAIWLACFALVLSPDSLVQINVQGETNIHNSFGYLFDHLFILGFFVWGCVLPLLYWYEPIWRWYQSRLGIPVPSLGLSVAMLGVTLFQEQITDSLFGVVPGLRVPELRELMSALCFLLMMIGSRELTAGKQKTAESLARVSG